MFDFLVRFKILANLFLFFGLIYIILKISGIDKPIYKQIRSGKDNKNFMIYKFRTYKKKKYNQIHQKRKKFKRNMKR